MALDVLSGKDLMVTVENSCVRTFTLFPTCYFHLMVWAVGTCTVKTLNIGTPRPATVVALNIKPFNFTMK